MIKKFFSTDDHRSNPTPINNNIKDKKALMMLIVFIKFDILMDHIHNPLPELCRIH